MSVVLFEGKGGHARLICSPGPTEDRWLLILPLLRLDSVRRVAARGRRMAQPSTAATAKASW